MVKGGARARSGPPADPNALRRERDGVEWVALPPVCELDPPTFPLAGQSEREAELWAEMWRKPQAVMWHRNQQAHEVALFVRSLAGAEKPDSPVNLSTLVRQMLDSLGLSVPGLRANRWRIDEVEADEAAKKPAQRRSSSKARLKVVPGDGADG